MEEYPIVIVVSILGFGLGGIFGATAQKTHFCTMGAISDAYFMGDWNRFRSWMLALAIAMAGSQYLHLTEALDLNESIYLAPNLGWAGSIIGGLMFGFGMSIAGGCGNKTLVRLGAGNLKSLVVAVILAVFAYMTLRGLIGMARVELEAFTNIDLTDYEMASQGIPEFLAGFGFEESMARTISVICISGGLLVFCFKSAAFRASKADIAAGVIIGLLIPAAWYVTGVIGYDDFDPTPLASFTFITPVAEGLQYLMTFTGSTINFGIAVVGGIITGSFIAAKISNEFQFEAFHDATDMGRHIIGGALMGTGGVLALGCTIGQGITGMSTLAFGSLIALLSIITGGVLGLKYLEEDSFSGALASLFGSSD